jgi:hypothetical protein
LLSALIESFVASVLPASFAHANKCGKKNAAEKNGRERPKPLSKILTKPSASVSQDSLRNRTHAVYLHSAAGRFAHELDFDGCIFLTGTDVFQRHIPS